MTDDQIVPFATGADLFAFTGGQITGDDVADDALAGASNAIRAYCGWHVTPQITDTLHLDGPGGRELTLPSLSVASVDAIRENGTVVASSDYRVSNRLGQVRRTSGCWSDEYGAIEVDLVHGFTSVPEFKTLVLALVARGLASRLGAVREQTLSSSVTWALVAPGVTGGLALLPHELALLAPYRIAGA